MLLVINEEVFYSKVKINNVAYFIVLRRQMVCFDASRTLAAVFLRLLPPCSAAAAAAAAVTTCPQQSKITLLPYLDFPHSCVNPC